MDNVLSLHDRELKSMLAELKQVVQKYDRDADILVRINDGKTGGKAINIIINDESEIDIVFDRVNGD